MWVFVGRGGRGTRRLASLSCMVVFGEGLEGGRGRLGAGAQNRLGIGWVGSSILGVWLRSEGPTHAQSRLEFGGLAGGMVGQSIFGKGRAGGGGRAGVQGGRRGAGVQNRLGICWVATAGNMGGQGGEGGAGGAE